MPVKKTSFGPVAIVLRGAGSLGHDPQQIGSGKDIGLDIQIPVNQTANAFQISKPDGTMLYALGPNGNPGGTFTTVAAANFAVPLRAASYLISSPTAAAWSITPPVAGTMDGLTIRIMAATVPATGNHTVTSAVGCFVDGSATAPTKNLMFFNNLCSHAVLMAFNGLWVLDQYGASNF